jgi:hypothetical protein
MGEIYSKLLSWELLFEDIIGLGGVAPEFE